ncbi:hypothetical protein PMAYCL1PPCAC_30086, partial [Pristionchus mayeri]
VQPWDRSLRAHLLAKLTPHFVHSICKEIKTLFRHDIGANRLLVNNQLRMWNLRLALENNMSPADMTKLEPLLVKKNSLGVVTDQPAAPTDAATAAKQPAPSDPSVDPPKDSAPP